MVEFYNDGVVQAVTFAYPQATLGEGSTISRCSDDVTWQHGLVVRTSDEKCLSSPPLVPNFPDFSLRTLFLLKTRFTGPYTSTRAMKKGGHKRNPLVKLDCLKYSVLPYLAFCQVVRPSYVFLQALKLTTSNLVNEFGSGLVE